MRRQLHFDDIQIPTISYQIISAGSSGKQQRAINTQKLQMKHSSMQTIIHSGQKIDWSDQTNPHIMNEDYEKQRSKQEQFKKARVKIQKQIRVNSQGQEFQDQQEQQQSPILKYQQSQQDTPEQTLRLVQRFLKKVSPLMEAELQENFPKYNLLGAADDKSFFRRDSKLVHTLENLQSLDENFSKQPAYISDISWNATGITVAASYAKDNHEGTCVHKGMIALWFIFKRNFKPTKPQIIKTSNCINCLSFHPKKPSILACGLFSGEILLFDVSKKQEQLIGKSTIDDYHHRDIITKIIWWPFSIPGRNQIQQNLLSIGTDGKILLWQISNQAIAQDAPIQKSKMLLKHPLKGFLMLRKKQGEVIPVSGYAICQSKINKNMFFVGSQGGSVLRATLSPISHYHNKSVLLDIQQTVKFKESLYPFLLNIVPKHLPQVKAHVQKYCTQHGIKEVDSLMTIFASAPKMKLVYSNPISLAYDSMAFPISSIYANRYGMFIANAYEGYSRIFLEDSKKSLQNIETGYEWGWIDSGSKMGGFIEQQWVVVDFVTQQVIWSIGVGQGAFWRQSGHLIAIACQGSKVRIVELGDKIINETQDQRKNVLAKIEELKIE